jgi:hypothetical protein
MTHEQRVMRHLEAMEMFGAPTTRENLTRLAKQREKTARRLRGKTKPDARAQRLAYLQTARAFYTLARRAVA